MNLSNFKKVNKTIKYAINGALFLGIGNAMLNAFKQLNEDQKASNLDWNRILKAFGKGAFLGGASGLVLGSIKDNEIDNILIATGGVSGYLKQTLDSYEENALVLENKATKIQYQLFQTFNHFLVQFPTLSGSKQRGTSIIGSDIDIQLKFKKNAGTIEYIRRLVEDYFYEKYEDRRLIKIRNQNCSIGLIFKFYNREYRIDIVPMREIKNGKGDAFLYVKSNSIFESPTKLKTNSSRHLKTLRFSAKQKKIIKLLKGWKKLNDIEIPSIYIELIVKRISDEISLPTGIFESLLRVIEYIGDNVRSIRIVDPANSNNVISEYLTVNEKTAIQEFCYKMLSDIEKDERNIVDYFPDWE